MRLILSYGPAMVGLLVFTACGGEPAARSDAAGDVARQTTPATSDRTGNVTVVIGDETFRFELDCGSGTTLLMGPGTRDDGTPAFLAATFFADEPEGADIVVRVGTAEQGGPADGNWSAGDTYGNSAGVTWTGDRRSVQASAPFRDRENDVVVDGSFAETMGTLEAICP